MAPFLAFLSMAVMAIVACSTAVGSPPPPPVPPPATGRPTSCMRTLLELFECGTFLSTGNRLQGPAGSCCSSLRAVLGTPASICLCHVYGGEINDVFNINVDPLRLAVLPVVCLAIVPPQIPYMCFVGPIPPIRPNDQPPTPALKDVAIHG